MQDDNEMKAWDEMVPVGREWGAPNAEMLWALDTLAERLEGTPMELIELDEQSQWCLRWQDQELMRWQVGESDLGALRATIMDDVEALAVWDEATELFRLPEQ